MSGGIVSEAVGSEPESLKDLTYLTEEFPPYNYEENGTPAGLAVDLLLAATKETREEIYAADVRIVPLKDGLGTVRNTTGSVIFSIAKTPGREGYYRWVGPFASYDIVLFSLHNRDIRISSRVELTNYTIGAVTSDVSVEELIKSGVSPDRIITSPDPEDLFRMLDTGKVDLVTSGDIAGEYFIKKMNGNPESYRVSYRMDSTPLYFAFNRNTSEELISRFSKALNRLSRAPSDGGLSLMDKVKSEYSPAFGLSSLKFYTEDYYPFNFMENNTPAGISIQLLGEIFKRFDTNLSAGQISLGVWDDGYHRTLNQTGTVLFSTARSPEREDLFRWVGPILAESDVIFSRTDRQVVIRKPEDLNALKIGAVRDDIASLDLAEAGKQDIVLSSDAKTLILALENGSIDGWAYARDPGLDQISRYAKNPSGISPVYSLKVHDYYYAFNRDTPLSLVQSFQRALDLIKSEKNQDGTSVYDAVLKQYNISPVSDSASPEE